MNWISVKDRLPDGDMEVLVCYADGALGMAQGGDKTSYTHFGVTHWMPLPEPPESEVWDD